MDRELLFRMVKSVECLMRHAILGAGGVGGLMAACLARSGSAVTMLVKAESIGQYPKVLRLESPFGDFSVEVDLATSVPAVGVLWITVKATQLESALASIPESQSIGAVVPLLNGIDHVPLLRSKFSKDQVVPATIRVESERVAPGYIVHRSPFARVEISSAGKTLLGSTVEQLQQQGFSCQFVDDEQTLLWGKLVFLAPIALTTSAASKTVGEIVSSPDWKLQLQACVREACAVAKAEGAKVDAESALSFLRTLPGNMRSSMQKDVEQGNTPELDAIGGAILRAARRHGLEVPVTRWLIAQVQERVSPKIAN